MAKKKKKTNGKARLETRMNEQNRLNKIIRQQAAAAGIMFNKDMTQAADPKSGTNMVKETLKTMQLHANYLVSAGIALSTEYLSKVDLIDITNCSILNLADTEDGINIVEKELEEFLTPKELEFYRCLPCLSEAIIKYKQDLLLYFKMLSVDTENQMARAIIQEYDPSVKDRDDVLPTDEISLYDETEVSLYRDDSGHVHYHVTSKKTVAEIYELLPGENEVLTELQQHLLKLSRKRFRTDAIKPDTAAIRLELYTQMINYTIEKSRTTQPEDTNPNDKKNPPESIAPRTRSKTSDENGKTPEKQPPETVTHVYGGVRVLCKKSRRLRQLGPRNYITPSWTAKGHIRKYKSGKVVYIKPTTRHRKSLKNLDGKVPQTIVEIK